jgi:methionine sulfoxide reductase heme-binding subunit
MSGLAFSSTALWYASRATGIVCLLLLSAVAILGILVNRQGRLPGLPQFAVTGLHRNLSLLATTFLAVHVLTAIADSYVSIRLIAAIVPFTSSYEPLWMGLGAVALDLIAAVIITSLVRLRLGRPVWRAVHLFSYAAFPVAVAHSIGGSKDLQSGWLLALTAGCVLAVCAAIGYRLRQTLPAPRTEPGARPGGARRPPPPSFPGRSGAAAEARGPHRYPHPPIEEGARR